jgi:transcription elongation factor GreA
MDRFPMTPACLERLEKELQHLKSVERPEIAKAIEEAREHGDLKENAEYHAAKDQQGFVEARIRDLEAKTAMAEVIDPTRFEGPRIRFGATVTLLDLDTDDKVKYSIVGEEEANFKYGLLNYKSPIARGILGKEEGDLIDIETAGGDRSFEILEVEYHEIELPEEDKKIDTDD